MPPAAVLAVAVLMLLAPRLHAQTAEPALPRVIYGMTDPQVIYGPASTPPAVPAPRPARPLPPPQAAAPPPPGAGTAFVYEWVPVGPPVWGPPGLRPPPPPPPPRDTRFERPLPMGTYVGRPPSAPPEPPPPFPRERR